MRPLRKLGAEKRNFPEGERREFPEDGEPP